MDTLTPKNPLSPEALLKAGSSLFPVSVQAFKAAKAVIPGGVNSPVRAFKGVGLPGVEVSPLFIEKAKGAHLWDRDGNRYIDYVGSFGPAILGHAHPEVVRHIQTVAERGLSFGAPTELETELAELVIEAVPSIEKVRFVNSGTEAVMSAVRLARAVTGRRKIIKFIGCYHGHMDALLVKAGSGAATLGVPDSAGVPESATADTMTLPYNNTEALAEVFNQHGKDIAAVLIEPVAGNMGCVPPKEGYLDKVRTLCHQAGSLLIFDEVMTGFRVAYGGAQDYYSVMPDITVLGKVIGGGLPVGAYGASKEIMAHVAPEGPMYQAGTLSGNPLTMASGIETLRHLKQPKTYERLSEKTNRLVNGWKEVFDEAGIPVVTTAVGSMFSLFFTDKPVTDYDSVKQSHAERFIRFYWCMIAQGIYMAPSPFEAGFMSLAHSSDDIVDTIQAAKKAVPHLST